jgi:hypothetical protein
VKTLVVDASVGVKWQLDDEEHVDKANVVRVLEGAGAQRAEQTGCSLPYALFFVPYR